MVDKESVKTLIETYYNVNVEEVTLLTQKVYCIKDHQKMYVFKFARGSDEFLVKQLHAYRALPKHVLPIYKTVTNAYCIKLDYYFCYLTDYVIQVPMPIEKRVLNYAQMLQQLHQNTLVRIEVSQSELTQLYEHHYQQLQKSYESLQKQMRAYELTEERSPYEWYFMMVYPMLYGMLQRAHDELKKFYDCVQKEPELMVCLTHGDVNVANMVVTEQNAYLLNFEKSIFTFASIDLSALLESYHHIQGIKSFLLKYLEKEDETMRCFFFFKALTFDVEELTDSLTTHSLTNIAMLNERLAPYMLALQLYDTLNSSQTAQQSS